MRCTRQKPARLPNSNIDSVFRLRRPTVGGAPTTSCRNASDVGVALERRPLAALLVVEDEAERDARATGPARVGRLLPVADEVARGHPTSPNTPASASSPTRSGV